MTNFLSHSQAKAKAEEISNKFADYTNEGLEINLTSQEKEQANQIATSLKSVFSDVKVKGRKFKTIQINFVSKISNNFHISQVTY